MRISQTKSGFQCYEPDNPKLDQTFLSIKIKHGLHYQKLVRLQGEAKKNN